MPFTDLPDELVWAIVVCNLPGCYTLAHTCRRYRNMFWLGKYEQDGVFDHRLYTHVIRVWFNKPQDKWDIVQLAPVFAADVIRYMCSGIEGPLADKISQYMATLLNSGISTKTFDQHLEVCKVVAHRRGCDFWKSFATDGLFMFMYNNFTFEQFRRFSSVTLYWLSLSELGKLAKHADRARQTQMRDLIYEYIARDIPDVIEEGPPPAKRVRV